MNRRPLALWPTLCLAVGLLACGEGFSRPTDVAFLSDGSVFVSDGYGNARVARLDDGRVIDTWGEHGSEPGEFNIPHGITVDDRDHVYIADRGNARVQIFDRDGAVLDQWDAAQVGRPWGLEYHAGLIFIIDGGDQIADAPAGRVVVMSLDGEQLGTFGEAGIGPGQFRDAHDITVDATGAVYVAELGGRRVQKFVPVR